MIALGGTPQFFLCTQPVDMRKSFEGLGGVVQNIFEEDILSGNYFIFINRSRDRMQVLYWDKDGLAIWYKRLEKGIFSTTNLEDNKLDRREFLMLLEGVTPKHVQKRYKKSK